MIGAGSGWEGGERVIDLRVRSVVIKIGEKYHLIQLRPAIFGRVKDVSVWDSDDGYLYHPSTEIKIKPQNISAKDAVKQFCDSILWDIKHFLFQLFQKEL